jgi:hypothetical protein
MCKLSDVHVKFTFVLRIHRVVLALANVGLECDPCGRPLKVIVLNKNRDNVLVFQSKFVCKIEMLHCIFFIITNAQIPYECGPDCVISVHSAEGWSCMKSRLCSCSYI